MQPLTILSLLAEDHRQVDQLFTALARTTARGVRKRRELFATLDEVLTLHADFEERQVYPLLKDHRASEGFALEAVEDHRAIRQLLARVRGMAPDDERWGQQVAVLAQIVLHHVQEEEGEAFPRLRELLGERGLEELGAAYAVDSDDGTRPEGLPVVRRRDLQVGHAAAR